ncbi:amino acid ABC transporter ATP-binding protein [Rummeliibacillus pycnus]|uniref:amino acid ABC transporter ATP-binding protein n=1 Tax=Rummeliibacillus pycnus TaxID=101070 RepID=UPI000C9A4721|nr:amino acid ABC transporter ATP-binding protein [Rummeliibacillus pycnus]
MVQFKNITKTFGDHTALKNISIQFHEGETTVILGPSGSGKSTLLRCINLLELPDRGMLSISPTTITFDQPITKNDKMTIRKNTAMVFQSFNLFPHRTVIENVIEGPVTVLKQEKQQSLENAKELLAKVGMSQRENYYPSQLSGGQQQRVAIARALAMNPKFLLFDEPTSALDPELEGEVLKVLQKLSDEGKSMIIVTHNLNFARKVADRILFLENGELLFEGLTEQFFNNSNERIQAFIQSMEFI